MTKYLLTNLKIDVVSDEIGTFLDKCKVVRKDVMRIEISIIGERFNPYC